MKKMKLFLTAGAALLLVSSNVKSQDVTYQYPASAAVQLPQPFTVVYLGEDSDYLLFKVVVKSSVAKHADLSINDRSEGEIYSASFKTSYKEQILKIEKQHNQELDFRLYLGKTVYSKSFNAKTYKTGSAVAVKF
jgi:methenyltetrahydromethanopterin cyclohydrolase